MPLQLVAALYRNAERDLKAYEGKVEPILLLTMGIMLAHEAAARASMYLYGQMSAAMD